MSENIKNSDLRLSILNIIRNKTSITKQEIAQRLKFNLTTISKLVNELYFSAGLLKITGDDSS